ncbi:sulfotransferase domain-containing protein [Nisaea nitritireducens]|uniref:sulfotransferase domain-containing protein n=1 Tax=Nisaea nitritireducens TaxID=568392 RepID=UPI0018691F09|nr:sulfotransferase domain-containing protein [Nisaea nitritireducens]
MGLDYYSATSSQNRINSEETRSIIEAVLNESIKPDIKYLKNLAFIAYGQKNFDQSAILFSIVLASGSNKLQEQEYAIWHRLIQSLGTIGLAVRILDHWHERDPDFHWNIWMRHPSTPRDSSRRQWFNTYQKERIREEMPSVFLNTMHKSGSMTLLSAFIDLLDLPTCRISLDTQFFDKVIPSWARQFAKGGALTQEHLPGTDENIDALVKAGVRKIVVHLRRPEQAIISAEFHNEKVAATSPILDPTIRQPNPENRKERLEESLHRDLPVRAKWVADWMHARSSRDDIDIHLSTFEQLVTDPSLSISEICHFYEVPMQKNRIELENYRSERNHFRSGRLDEWKEEFTEPQRALAQNVLCEHIPRDFLEELRWTE